MIMRLRVLVPYGGVYLATNSLYNKRAREVTRVNIHHTYFHRISSRGSRVHGWWSSWSAT